MLKLLIVDDEPLVRNGLARGFDWKKMGVEIAGSACNGKEAIIYIEEEAPDIVITDIKMPEMDGLELAAWIRRFYPEIAVVFLTGYNEFSFAKKAIELDAVNYLLKPVEEEELLEVFEKLKHSLAAKNKKEEQYQKAIETLNANMPVLREKFIDDVLNGRIPEEEILHRAEFFGLELSADRAYFVVKIELFRKDSSSGDTIASLEIEKERLLYILRDLLQGFEMSITRDGTDNFQILFACEQGVYDNKCVCLDAVYQNVREMLERFKSPDTSVIFSITAGVSSLHIGINSLSLCSSEAGEALKSKVYMGKNNVILYSELMPGGTRNFPRINNERLRSLLLEGDSKGLDSYVKEYFDFFRINPQVIMKYKDMVVFSIVSAAIEILGDYCSGNDPAFDYTIMESLAGSETLDELYEKVRVFLRKCRSELENSRNCHSMIILDNIISYINSNYSKDINLKTVSMEFSINSSYLSRIFSAKTGFSFTEYLNDLRMNRARELLQASELGVGIIARNVGYVNERYFSRLFKKRENMTPQEYRNIKK